MKTASRTSSGRSVREVLTSHSVQAERPGPRPGLRLGEISTEKYSFTLNHIRGEISREDTFNLSLRTCNSHKICVSLNKDRRILFFAQFEVWVQLNINYSDSVFCLDNYAVLRNTELRSDNNLSKYFKETKQLTRRYKREIFLNYHFSENCTPSSMFMSWHFMIPLKSKSDMRQIDMCHVSLS